VNRRFLLWVVALLVALSGTAYAQPPAQATDPTRRSSSAADQFAVKADPHDVADVLDTRRSPAQTRTAKSWSFPNTDLELLGIVTSAAALAAVGVALRHRERAKSGRDERI
jgi:hypothetical protein